jgi:hypothetical protein
MILHILASQVALLGITGTYHHIQLLVEMGFGEVFTQADLKP